ncbi:O-acetylserine sulfhydrylase [Trichoderma ghanense]|uniref:O-acetylserine sulfhydrylase n=1 Tax=Trichoderma ghanense TaxID=65468 RepID=A0ABY2GWR0_9HYPO
MIPAAGNDGYLKPGAAAIEYTGGSTGVSFAVICSVKKHSLHVVALDIFSREKIDHMRLPGAQLTLIPSDNSKQTEKLTNDMVREAYVLTKRTGAYVTTQMENSDQLTAYTKLANEIYEQTEGRIDAFVQTRFVAVEPEESAVSSGGPSGFYKIDSTGRRHVEPLWYNCIAGDFQAVSTADARAMVYRLAREEGLFCRLSTAANVTAALRIAEGLKPGSTAAAIA